MSVAVVPSRALVIGIDGYARPAWRLDSAVRDAILFAGWAVAEGGVAPENLTLLLSSAQDTVAQRLASAGLGHLAVRPADTRAIETALFELETPRAGVRRLFVYYAGHGVAPPLASPEAGPVIVPADVDNLALYLRRRIELATAREAMQAHEPPEQYWFVDACREVLEADRPYEFTTRLQWNIPKVEQGATQCVLFASSAGQRAREAFGRGLFTRALLNGLRGRGPRLAPLPPHEGPGWRLSFNALAEYVARAVGESARAAGLGEGMRAQDPYAAVTRLAADPTLARFARDAIPPATLTLLLAPPAALAAGSAAVLKFDEDSGQYVPRADPAPLGSPLPDPPSFTLRTGTWWIRVASGGFRDHVEEVVVDQDRAVPIELEPDGGGARSGLESLQSAAVTLHGPDALAQIELRDAAGSLVAQGVGWLSATGLAEGVYRASAHLAGRGAMEHAFALERGEHYARDLAFAAPPRDPALEQYLQHLGVGHDPASGAMYPAEPLGRVASPRVGSLLAYAAWAQDSGGSGWGHKLGAIGVDPIGALDDATSAVRVFVALDVPGGEPVRARVRLAREAGAPAALPLAPLAGMPGAVHAIAVGSPGQAWLELDAPGVLSARYPTPLVSGMVSVLILARETDGDLEVHRYLYPAHRGGDPADIRRWELGWRAVEENLPVTATELDELASHAAPDPMLAVGLAWRLVQQQRDADLARLRPALEAAPWLPDAHVLLARIDPARADAHRADAVAAGLPLFARGLHALVAASPGRRTQATALARHALPGSVWTAFTGAVDASGAGGSDE